MVGDIRRFPRPGPSNSRPFAVGVGIPAPARVGGNKPLYSSAISDCWNSSSSNTPTASTSASARASLNELSTTCLFCPNNVQVPNPLIREPPGVLGRRNKLLKNLCFHLEINTKELPKDGTRAMFPFCYVCDKNVKDLMSYHEELEKVKEKISQAVTNIQRIVADRQILGSKEPPTPIESQKFVKLYDMILEGYRSKLLKRHQESDALNRKNNLLPTYSQMGGLRNGSNGRNSQKLQNGITITPSPSSSGGSATKQEYDGVEILEDMTVHMDPLDVGAEIEVGDVPLNPNFNSPSPDINDQEEEENYGEFEDESSVYENGNLWNNMEDEEEQEEQQNLIYNDNSNCNLVISNVQSRAATSSSGAGSSRANRNKNRSKNKNRNRNIANPPPQVIDVVNVPNVKQEMMDEEEESEEEVDDGDGTSAAVYGMAEPKRKMLYEGIEILKVSGTGSRKNEEFIQCSACDFTLHVPKVTRREAKSSDELSPHMKMKMHILNVHKKIPGPVKPRAKPQFTCGCDITFPNLAALRDHNKVYPHPKYLPCDICGRPIKGGVFNLQMHKHSHRNDEERKLALENGERGAYSSFLSSKIESVYVRKMRKQQMDGLISGAGSEAGPSPVASSSSAAGVTIATGGAVKRAQTGGTGGPASKKRCRTSRGGASRAKFTPTATPKPSTPATPKPTLIAVPNPSPARDRATSRARNRGEVAVAKPYGCRICNKHFSQKNHLTLHNKTHFQTRSERRRGAQLTQEEGEEEEEVEERLQEEEEVGVQEEEEGVQEEEERVLEEEERVLEEEEGNQEEDEGVQEEEDMEEIEEPTPSTSAAAVATSETESTGSRTSSRRRLVLVGNGDVGPPPLLSPQDNIAHAENLPSAVGEVGNPTGMPVGDLGVGEGGGEETVQGEVAVGDGEELEAPVLKREVM